MPVPPENLSRLETEGRNPRTSEMDSLDTSDLVRTLHAENYTVAAALEPLLPLMAQVVDILAERWERGGRLFYVGAGTSGRLGVLDASECPPTFGVPAERVQGIIAGGPVALTTSIEGAEDSPEAGAQEITARAITAQDVVVGIAASGRTPFVRGALAEARRIGAVAVAVVNVSEALLSQEADFTLAAVTGPEPLTGSTRLKAGTAQKMLLNLLTTATMVRVGKVYGNLMVDVRATNAKLRDRAVRIVMTAAEVDHATAQAALQQADWHAKTAIVMLRGNLTVEEARRRLDSAHGWVRVALNSTE